MSASLRIVDVVVAVVNDRVDVELAL